MDKYDYIDARQITARFEDCVPVARERNRKIIDEQAAEFRENIVGVLNLRFPKSRWNVSRILSEKSWDELRSLLHTASSCDSAEDFRRALIRS